ncbi:hypothetical protein EMGBS15_00730 [Filimonas sp.]|nr:hypothetical protein EMGBS15_00730 [Filimonas sp.]
MKIVHKFVTNGLVMKKTESKTKNPLAKIAGQVVAKKSPKALHTDVEDSIAGEAVVAYTPQASNRYKALTKTSKVVYTDMDMLTLIRKGVSKKMMDDMMDTMDITIEEMSAILHVSTRTLRRYDQTTSLNMEQSERIIELSDLYGYGEKVLDNLNNFKIWIDTPMLALGQKKPKEFLDTSVGIRMIKNILGRIEHGVYS